MENILSNLSKEQIAHIVKVFDIQIAIVIVLVVFFTKNIVSKIILNIFYKIFKIEKKPQESESYGTIKFIYVFIGIYLASKILPLEKEWLAIREALLHAAIVIFIAKIINTTILVKDSKLFKKVKTSSKNDTVNEFICKIARGVVWFITAYIIFLQLGYDLSGLMTGLGIGTVIISLAAQDTVKSLLSGVTILTDKPFVIGDWISIGAYAGTVIDITFRSTRIRCSDNSIVTIPNSTITNDYIINWNKLKTRRFECILNIDRNTSTDKIKKVIKELKVVICSKDFVKSDTVYVGFNKISTYSSDIKIFLYVNETDYVKFLKLEEELNCEFLNVLEKENIDLVYPTETIHIKNQD